MLVCCLLALGDLITKPLYGTDHDWWHRSGVETVTDYKTGMQYLHSGSGITRLDRGGILVLNAKAGAQ